MTVLPPKADVHLRSCYVAFVPTTEVARSFDHLVGAAEQRKRNGQPERLSGLEVDDQLDFRGLLDRHIGGALALEDAMDVAGRNYFGILTVEDVVRFDIPDSALSARGGRPLACRAGYPRSCGSSCLTSAARCGGTGVARASYWSLRHCPIADSPTRLSRAGFTLL
jgi:hypothetical protein